MHETWAIPEASGCLIGQKVNRSDSFDIFSLCKHIETYLYRPYVHFMKNENFRFLEFFSALFSAAFGQRASALKKNVAFDSKRK